MTITNNIGTQYMMITIVLINKNAECIDRNETETFFFTNGLILKKSQGI